MQLIYRSESRYLLTQGMLFLLHPLSITHRTKIQDLLYKSRQLWGKLFLPWKSVIHDGRVTGKWSERRQKAVECTEGSGQVSLNSKKVQRQCAILLYLSHLAEFRQFFVVVLIKDSFNWFEHSLYCYLPLSTAVSNSRYPRSFKAT